MDVINNNTSYTNKDFNSIYAELLDIIPNITNKWNPSSEADPGVVLVKLMAVLGDKLNYNIDKQVLEMFPASVTQRKNARQMFRFIGYNMSWYQAAEASVGIKVKSLIQDESGVETRVTIPRFTRLTNSKNSVSFVTVEPVTLYGNDLDTIKYVKALQGNLINYTVNNSTDIKLSNLDENYKLYLTDIPVAENGIFVCDAGSDLYDWQQVDNIDSYPSGSKVFEFGINDAEDQCYLRFPADVNNVSLADALNISYVVCNGASGNILSNVITAFTDSISDSAEQVVEDKLAITQPDATSNGADPETIEEAYKNSRKYVGTFETLVTKQDFENFIKLAKDSSGIPIVSNVVCSDRNDDLNCVSVVKTLQKLETKTEKIKTGITPYDIVARMLKYVPVNLDDGVYACDTAYNESFESQSDSATLLMLEDMMSDVKAINVDISVPTKGTVLYKGVYTLTAELVMVEKITQDEATELEVAVKKNLEKIYHSYNMEFGKQIDYSELIDNILSIDSRIKAVSLRGIDYTPKITKPDAGDAVLTDDDRINVIAHTVASGHLQMFNFEDGFEADFGQAGAIEDVSKVFATFNPTLSAANPIELAGNQIVNFYAPKITNTKTYTSGVKVIWSPSDYAKQLAESVEDNGVTIVSDGSSGETSYKLFKDNYFRVGTGSDQIGSFKITYTDASGVKQEDTIKQGTLIKLDQDIINKSSGHTLSTGNSLYLYEADTFNLSTNTRYLLHLSAYTDKVTFNAGDEILLQDNDFLLYYEKVSASWVQLGSGYTIKNNNTSGITLNVVAADDISNTSKFSELPASLTIIDNDIVSAGEGCVISYAGAASLTINFQPKELQGAITITDGSGATTELYKNEEGTIYKVFTRLDIIYNNEPIKLGANEFIALTVGANITTTYSKDTYIAFNQPVAIIGGSQPVDVSADGLRAYHYKETDNDAFAREDGIHTLTNNEKLTLNVGTTHLLSLVPIYVKSGTFKLSESKVYDIQTNNSFSTEVGVGNYILAIPNNVTTMQVTVTGETQVGEVTIVNSINASELSGDEITISNSVSDSSYAKIIYKIKDICGSDYKFNFTYRVPNADKCASPTTIENFFNSNHVYNKFTIAQMDTENYNIIVNQFSIK